MLLICSDVMAETSKYLQAYTVQGAPDLILPVAPEDVPLDGEDGQALGAIEGSLPQQAATTALAPLEVSAMHKQESSIFQHFINILHSSAGVLVSFNH